MLHCFPSPVFYKFWHSTWIFSKCLYNIPIRKKALEEQSRSWEGVWAFLSNTFTSASQYYYCDCRRVPIQCQWIPWPISFLCRWKGIAGTRRQWLLQADLINYRRPGKDKNGCCCTFTTSEGLFTLSAWHEYWHGCFFILVSVCFTLLNNVSWPATRRQMLIRFAQASPASWMCYLEWKCANNSQWPLELL